MMISRWPPLLSFLLFSLALFPTSIESCLSKVFLVEPLIRASIPVKRPQLVDEEVNADMAANEVHDDILFQNVPS